MKLLRANSVTKVKLESPIYKEQGNQELLVKLNRHVRKAIEGYHPMMSQLCPCTMPG